MTGLCLLAQTPFFQESQSLFRNVAVLLLVVAIVAFPQSKHAKSKQSVPPPAEKPKPFNVVEATIPEMRAAMEQGRVTSRELVVQYLTRIGMYEDQLHAVMMVNPHA